MSAKLRELIRNIRSCKTAAEERAVIAKECAAIRTAFREDDSHFRHRNVAKLLLIHMLGYPTQFGQMECLKLIATTQFPLKRVGYLGLTQLLDENTEVLMLVTNSIKNDMLAANQFINALAICALGNVGTAEMCNDLASEVEKLLGKSDPYVRKKAALCAMRCVRRVEEIEDKFNSRIQSMLEDRNHGVQISGISLCLSICQRYPEYIPEFRKLIPTLVKNLKSLLTSGYSNASEYDVNGVTDPFLQCGILKLLRFLGRGDADASDEMNDVLAQLATNTEGEKNAGNAILYEAVLCIMAIEAEQGLRILGINILGKFLLMKDNNIRYVALSTLYQVVKVDLKAVQRHRATILDCLKDPDVSIQKRALAVIYNLINDDNIKQMMKELLNFLLVAEPEVKEELVLRISHCVDRFGPNQRWQIDTLIKVMCLAGNHVKDETQSQFCQILSCSPPDLQAYTVHKCYFSMLENTDQKALMMCGSWAIGEFGDLLINGEVQVSETGPAIVVNANDVLSLFEKICKKTQYNSNSADTVVLEYIANALVKLSTRFPVNFHSQIASMLKPWETHISPELQQRSCEYGELLDGRWTNERPDVLDRIPEMQKIDRPKKAAGDITFACDEVQPAPRGPRSQGGQNDPFDLLGDLGGGGTTNTTSKPTNNAVSLLDDLLGPSTTTTTANNNTGGGGLDDLLGLGGPTPTTTSTAPTPAANGGGGADLLGDLLGGPAPTKPTPAAQPAVPGGFVGYDKNGLAISFQARRENQNIFKVRATFQNKTGSPMNEMNFEAAVPKDMQLKMYPITSSVVGANTSNVTRDFDVASREPNRPLAIRFRLQYMGPSGPVQDQGGVDNFPGL